MRRISRSTRSPQSESQRFRSRLQVEQLEARNLLSGSGFALTPLVQVSGDSPLPAFINPDPPAPPKVVNNSEVEPQLAVDPTNSAQAVAVWQQDRFVGGGGARALVASVTNNADDSIQGATWSKPLAIPGFDATAPGAAYTRYTDPWVSIGPDGTIYATALAIDVVKGFPSTSASLVIKGTITVSGDIPSISWDTSSLTT